MNNDPPTRWGKNMTVRNVMTGDAGKVHEVHFDSEVVLVRLGPDDYTVWPISAVREVQTW